MSLKKMVPKTIVLSKFYFAIGKRPNALANFAHDETRKYEGRAKRYTTKPTGPKTPAPAAGVATADTVPTAVDKSEAHRAAAGKTAAMPQAPKQAEPVPQVGEPAKAPAANVNQPGAAAVPPEPKLEGTDMMAPSIEDFEPPQLPLQGFRDFLTHPLTWDKNNGYFNVVMGLVLAYFLYSTATLPLNETGAVSNDFRKSEENFRRE